LPEQKRDSSKDRPAASVGILAVSTHALRVKITEEGVTLMLTGGLISLGLMADA
jgi:hypothetical protein